MATNPQGAMLSQPLTDYALQILPDYKAVMAEAEFIAPRVVTGARKVEFAKFDTKQAFLAYDTQRAVGGARRRIKFAGATATAVLKPEALEAGLDDTEVDTDASRRPLEQAKVRTLLSNYANSRFNRTWNKAVTSGNYTASAVTNVGKWSDPNVDPIAKLDDAIVEFVDRSGVMPTRMIMALNNWVTLRNHPETIKRQPGAANVGITIQQLSGMLAVPLEIRISRAYLGTTGFGSATDVKQAKVKGYAMLFSAADVPSTEDPSAFKTFARNSNALDAVMMYRDNTCNSDIFYVEAEESVESVSALLATLITIS
jgi:hypothetical protein